MADDAAGVRPERTDGPARAGDSLVRRVERWRSRWFLILQTAVTAGLAWFVAEQLLGHPTPFFAPVAAIITLGVTFGQRMRRGVEIAIGVAVGVLVGDVFVRLFGSGVWQIMVVLVLAMSIATLLASRQLIIIQAGVQSVIVITLAPDPSQGFGRWLDAVVGCALALLVATVAPSAPLRKPAHLAAEVLDHLAATLDAAATELRDSDEAAGARVLEQARRTDEALAELDDATAEGLAVVRQSPFRRRQLPGIQAYAQLSEPLDHASRNLRVLARRSAVALYRGEPVPAPYRAHDDRAGRDHALHGRRAARRAAAHRRPGPAGGDRSGHLAPGADRLHLGRGHPGPGALDHRRPAGTDAGWTTPRPGI